MNKKTLLLITLGLALMLAASALTGCSSPSDTQGTTSQVQISHDKAVLYAATNVPYDVVRNASIVSLLTDNTWVIFFVLPDNLTVSRGELGWMLGPDTSFKNQGLLPPDTYRLLVFKIGGMTGDIISREASDSVILGGPGVFYIEPRPITQQLWFPISTAIAGVLAGGLVVWLILHQKPKAI
ncbi:MAG: hypothetical protein PHN78_00385 [Dehalococcoidales bacterium]|nr:hypothetical protein [Dehalococcoidales bacterium]